MRSWQDRPETGCRSSSASSMKTPSIRPAAVPIAIILFVFACGDLLRGKEKKSTTETPPPNAPESQTPSPRRTAGPQDDGTVLVTTNQMVTPLGKVQEVPGERPK